MDGQIYIFQSGLNLIMPFHEKYHFTSYFKLLGKFSDFIWHQNNNNSNLDFQSILKYIIRLECFKSFFFEKQKNGEKYVYLLTNQN